MLPARAQDEHGGQHPRWLWGASVGRVTQRGCASVARLFAQIMSTTTPCVIVSCWTSVAPTASRGMWLAGAQYCDVLLCAPSNLWSSIAEESQSPQAQSWSSKARCCLGTSSCPVNHHQSPVGPGTVCDVEVLVTRRLLPLICSLTARQRNLVWPVAPFDVLRRETSGQWIQSRTLIRALHQLQGFISTEPAWRAVAPASTLSASTLSATTTTPRLVGHSPCSEADSLEDSTRTKDAEKKRKRDRLRLIVLGAGS